MLNAASASAIFAALTALFAAACVFPLGRVPDWEDLRPLTWVALSAAAMAASNVVDTLDVAAAVHVWANRAQVLAVAVHVLAWLAYLPGWARRPERAPRAVWLLLPLGLLALVPGAVYGEALTARPLPWLGVVYRDAVVTPSGLAIWAAIGGFGAWGLGRMVRWSRTGAPYPRVHVASLGLTFLLGVHDAAVVAGAPLPTPYLLDLATSAMMVVFGVVTLRRIAANATEYHRLRSGLETVVSDRSRQLEESQAALARAERLAALGQFSAGVAHEVNNPAAAVFANLQYLSSELAGDPRAEVLATLEDARAGVRRITGLARQLLLAGRTASTTGKPLEPVRVADAVLPALSSARARAEASAAVVAALPDDLWVRAQQEPLVQILSNLLVNAVQAIPAVRTGTAAIRAEVRGKRVLLVVEDDGVGMSEEELRHVFEPFYSKKPPGMGTGLGLAVARSLVEGMKGTLRFESAVGRGTRALLDLERADPPGSIEGPAHTPPPAARAAVLVIDDDDQVLRSMTRLLGRQHDVTAAAGVRQGLQALEGPRPFDLILCDVMMPGGGGERFWAELLLRDPALRNRVAFMTGGAVTGQARAFLRRQPRPVLAKPFDSMAVDELLNAMPRASPPPPRDGEPAGESRPVAALGRLKR